MSAAITAAVIGVGGMVYGANQASDAAAGQANAANNATVAGLQEAALSHQLGTDQLNFAKQQYAENAPLARQVTQASLNNMNTNTAMGADYYNYMKTFRPVEQQLRDLSLRDRTQQLADYNNANAQDAAIASGTNQDVYNRNRADIENDVNNAIADTQGGYTRSLNQAITQGLRYGGSLDNITSGAGDLATQQAQATAAAANGARAQGINNARSRAMTSLQLRQSNMNASNQQDAIDWGRMLDAAGLVRGMPGASAGAYGLASSFGNNAVNSSLAAGNQYMQGLSQGANTLMTGANNYANTMTSLSNNYTDPSAQYGMAVGGQLAGMGTGYGLKFAGQYAQRQNQTP